ncbi:hypothetical protein HYN56_04045 [Flavobacterium crocinum]|uniref:DUF2975 domain-containing protein n=1 Tax=Flavobacterium crocinum TaxID=2183896 RepID=A0A2S1YHC8_9FLAO|nr:DUF2975 domain-containing protein [Flavobacterium crocinum]AWK03435.1 hypothetical protein HYN56_04045 [Flavobacterium crocinum]
MKSTKYFASFLYFSLSFIVIVYALYFTIGISAIFFGNDGQYIYKIGDTTTIIGNKNSEGTLVPVTLTVQIPDSININKSYFGASGSDTYPAIKNQFLKENKKTKAINLYSVNSMKEEGSIMIDENGNYMNRKPSFFKFIKYEHFGNSQYLKIKTTNTWTNFVLMLRGYLNALFYILEMYFLALILKELAKEIYFSKIIAKYVSKLGYLLLFSQLIPVIYMFVDLKLFGLITISPQILASLQDTYFENISVSFNPTIDGNIYIILLGCVLVLLTKLMERGTTLEEESELTI